MGRAVKIAAGLRASYAVLEDGSVWAWGHGECLALGTSEQDPTIEKHRLPGLAYVPNYRSAMFLPMKVPGPTDVVDISAGPYHAAALTRNGQVWVWGKNLGGGQSALPRKFPRRMGECASHVLDDVRPEEPHLLQSADKVEKIFASQNMS